jgi:hypothetical protein
MTTIDKTSPNAVAYRDRMRKLAIEVFDGADKLGRKMNHLACSVSNATHLIDGDREDTDELVSDLYALSELLRRVEAKATLVARRTKTTTPVEALSY